MRKSKYRFYPLFLIFKNGLVFSNNCSYTRNCHLRTETINFTDLIVSIFLNTITTKVMCFVYVFRHIIASIRIGLHGIAEYLLIKRIY